LPDSNRKNLEDIPNNLKNKLQFHFVSQIDQAVELCLNTTKNCKKI
jgi:ATP-dependent Lon protease